MTNDSLNIVSDSRSAGNMIFNQPEINPKNLWLDSVVDFSCARSTKVSGFYLPGVCLIWCTRGEFSFSEKGWGQHSIKSGDFLVLYPGHMIDISGLDKSNELTRIIVTGTNDREFADSIGLFDGFKGKDEQFARHNILPIEKEKSLIIKAPEKDRATRNAIVLRHLYDLLVAARERIRRQGSTLFYDAIKLFNADLETGEILVKQVAQNLNVSTNTLHLCFVRNGFKSPGDFVARRQHQLAQHLLLNTRLPIREIARKCGFRTAAHFTVFFKKRTGKLPSDLRR